jgi:hypothetical protein
MLADVLGHHGRHPRRPARVFPDDLPGQGHPTPLGRSPLAARLPTLHKPKSLFHQS